MTTKTIYGLVDPFTDEIRYIGQSADPEKRLIDHLYAKNNVAKAQWIFTLRSAGVRPQLVFLELVDSDEADESECWWILRGRKLGWNLFNVHLPNGERAISKAVTLYESDLVILRQAADAKGLSSLSATLRYVIRDWIKHQTSITSDAPMHVTEQPR